MIWFLITWIISGSIVTFFLIKESLEYGIITVKDIFFFIFALLMGYVSLCILIIVSFDDWLNFVIYKRKDK